MVIEADHYQFALNWLSQLNIPLRARDAIHLSIAAKNLLQLATCDQQLIRAAKHFGIKVVEF